MAIVTVDNIINSTDGFLTRGETTTIDGLDTYEFPIEQDFISITNNGNYDIVLNVNGYTNITIHPTFTFENDCNFTSFTIASTVEETDFQWTTKEYDNTLIDINLLWQLMEARDKTESGDMILTGVDLTSSAATVNDDIDTNDYFEAVFALELQNTATTAHTWFNGVFAVSAETDSADGIIECPAYVTFIDGVAELNIRYTGVWLATEVVTVTVTGGKKYGYPIVDLELTDTLGA